MEFLRRLAALREPCPSRAVAVLPSRFATGAPVRSAMAHPRRGDEGEEDPGSPGLATPSAPAPPASFDVPTPLATATPPHTRADGTRFDTVAAPVSTPAKTFDNDEDHGPAEPGSPDEPQPAGARVPRVAAALAADHGLEVTAKTPAQQRPAFPLTEAVVAQRALRMRDDSPVVHVTIGRIDVVTNTAPAPPARRSPARQGTVTLSEYLRRGNGSRR